MCNAENDLGVLPLRSTAEGKLIYQSIWSDGDIARAEACKASGQRPATSQPRASEARAPPWELPDKHGNKPQRGATNHASIPHVSFINLHTMFPAERPELILIGHLAMMLLLRGNIGADLLDV